MKRWILVLALLTACEKDADGDGYNDEVDCDDENAAIYPGAEETWYDGVDSDCAGDDDYDQDKDGYASDLHGGEDCNDADNTINPEGTEVCDGQDNDCNGTNDDNATDGMTMYADGDGDGFGVEGESIITCDDSLEGYAADYGDCNDDDKDMYPGNTEICDDKDNDCNDIPDDNPADALTWYADTDLDGAGDPDTMETGCNPPSDSVENGDDCNDDYSEIIECNSVFDMQTGGIPEGTIVVADGLVVTGVDKYGAFLQHPTGGPNSAIWAYGGTGSTKGLEIGSVVAISGPLLEYNDLTEIDFSDEDDSWLIRQGLTTPLAPEVVPVSDLIDADSAEQWESVLITIEDVKVTDEDMGFGEWEVSDLSDVGPIRIDDKLYKWDGDFENLSVDDTFDSITGPLYYSYGAFKIEPRAVTDLVGYTPPPS